jgi:hypothetical protein
MSIEHYSLTAGYLLLIAAESYAYMPRKSALAGLTTSELKGNTMTLPLRTRLWIKLPLAFSLTPSTYLLYLGYKGETYEKVSIVIMAIMLRMIFSSRIDHLLFWRKAPVIEESGRYVTASQAQIEKEIRDELSAKLPKENLRAKHGTDE